VKIWREDFLWSGASFIVAGSAGAGAAVVIARGQHWMAFLTMMPVYLVYRTYSTVHRQARRRAALRRGNAAAAR
jgi:hypothetical protein